MKCWENTNYRNYLLFLRNTQTPLHNIPHVHTKRQNVYSTILTFKINSLHPPQRKEKHTHHAQTHIHTHTQTRGRSLSIFT